MLIALSGLPGVGKTSIARALARATVDTATRTVEESVRVILERARLRSDIAGR